MSGAVEGVEDIWDVAFKLAETAAALNVACDGVKSLEPQRKAVLEALKSLARTTPPARSYADAIEDAAKVADDLCADMTIEARMEPGEITKLLHQASAQAAGKLATRIRLLSQGEKA